MNKRNIARKRRTQRGEFMDGRMRLIQCPVNRQELTAKNGSESPMKRVTYNVKRLSIQEARNERLRALRQDIAAMGRDVICIRKIENIPEYAASLGVRAGLAARTRWSRSAEAREARKYAPLVKLGTELAEKVDLRNGHRRAGRKLRVISPYVPLGPDLRTGR